VTILKLQRRLYLQKVNSLQITEHLIGEKQQIPYLPSLFGNGTAASYVDMFQHLLRFK
jgi:hypothetical protein